MRGDEAPQVNLFSYVHLEDRFPHRHPLRPVRQMVDAALAGRDDAFSAMKVGFVFTPSFAAYNLVRLRNLVAAAP